MPEPIVFYDIPGKDESVKAWSPNTWKTRFSLNYKGLPYKTVWVEYHDIEAVLRKLGIVPAHFNSNGTPLYTLPAIYDPNTKTGLSESAAIARYLDRTYPDTPRLIPPPTDALHAAFNKAFWALIDADIGEVMIPATVHALRPRSQVYFRATREASFGAKLEEIAPPGPVREKHWAGLRKAYQACARWLEADGSDKLFFLGPDTICYADITIASFLMWMKVILGPTSEDWTDVKTWDGGRWARFMEAFEKYEVVDAGYVLLYRAGWWPAKARQIGLGEILRGISPTKCQND